MYQVINWEDHFEGAKSKGYNNKTTCQMPTKHGLGYRRLVKQKNGAALFGAWCAMIQLLSRQEKPRQGYLTDTGSADGIPLLPEDLELLCDIPEDVFKQMLQVCASERVGWLTDTTRIPQDTKVSPQYPLNSDLDLDLDSNLDSDLDSDYNTPKPPKGASGYTADFDGAWKLYGLKGSKKVAFEKWKKLKDSEKDDAVKAIKYYLQETPDKQFRKDFERYLSQKVFEGVLERKESGTLANMPIHSPEMQRILDQIPPSQTEDDIEELTDEELREIPF